MSAQRGGRRYLYINKIAKYIYEFALIFLRSLCSRHIYIQPASFAAIQSLSVLQKINETKITKLPVIYSSIHTVVVMVGVKIYIYMQRFRIKNTQEFSATSKTHIHLQNTHTFYFMDFLSYARYSPWCIFTRIYVRDGCMCVSMSLF